MNNRILHVTVCLQGGSLTEDGNDKTRYHTYSIVDKSTFNCGSYKARYITYFVIGY